MAKERVLIVGGGYVGMYTAYRLQRLLRRGEATITVLDPRPNMTYQPFLPEAAAGSIEPRHVVVPLRRVLRDCEVMAGQAVAVDTERRTVTVTQPDGPGGELGYDTLVLAAGSIARTLPIPGLAETGIGFQTLGEAIYLRNHVLSRLDIAASTTDGRIRRRALTFVFVGGGYAGVEAFAESEDMARYAIAHYYPQLSPADMRWILVEAAPRILPEVSAKLADYTVRQLLRRGVDVRLSTRLQSAVGGHIVLSDGEEFDSDTLAWTAGVKANPLGSRTGLPVDAKGRLRCRPTMQVEAPDGSWSRGVWSAGDAAAVPDLSSKDPDAICSPSAQHAVRQAHQLAENIATVLHGGAPKPYVHAYAGSVASLGLHKGVAEIYGVRLRGFPAWFMHRTYHVSRVPTFNRKIRVIADWTLALFFRREIVSLGDIQAPRQAFETATRS